VRDVVIPGILSAALLLCFTEAAAQRVQCSLLREYDGSYQGECLGFEQGVGALRLEPHEPVGVSDAPMALPLDVTWNGSLQIPGWPRMRARIQTSPYEPEPKPVLKTDVAWLLVEGAILQGIEFDFRFQFDEDAPPTYQDLEIVETAAATLVDESVWDRSRNRQCSPGARTWTLYCALRDAIVEVTGEFHEYQPALVIMRQVIGNVFREMQFERPLIDYNAYEDAILSEMQGLLAMAASRIRTEL
jgi:hypothetical protein